jgi:hypothetical protein
MTGEAMKRFSLKTLFAVSTAIVLFLGYSQWRRQNILRESEQFREIGVTVHVPSESFDYVWQRRATSAEVHHKFRKTAHNGKMIDMHGNAELHRKLRAYGVKKVTHFADIWPDKPPQSQFFLEAIDDLSQPDRVINE